MGTGEIMMSAKMTWLGGLILVGATAAVTACSDETSGSGGSGGGTTTATTTTTTTTTSTTSNGGNGGTGGTTTSSTTSNGGSGGGIGGAGGMGGSNGGAGGVGPGCDGVPDPVGQIDPNLCGGTATVGAGMPSQCSTICSDEDGNSYSIDCIDGQDCTCSYNNVVYCTCQGDCGTPCCPEPWPQPGGGGGNGGGSSSNVTAVSSVASAVSVGASGGN
jgi:hypothetical protein